MKRFFLIALILASLLVAVPTLAVEVVVNQTACTGLNNLGTAVNNLGQTFLFNATSSGLVKVRTIQIGMINASTAPFGAGTIFRLRVHHNQSNANNTVLYDGPTNYSTTFTWNQAATATANCGSYVNVTVDVSSLGWYLNSSGSSSGGNYTLDVEVQNEGTAQLFEIVSNANPYALGRLTANITGFDVNKDNVFAITTDNFFLITAVDEQTGASITNFNATVNGTFYSTTNGTIVTTFTQNTGLLNISVNASNYWGRYYENYNSSTNLVAQLHQIEIYFTMKDFFTNATISNFSVKTNARTYGTASPPLWVNVSNATQTINFSATGYGNKNVTYTFSSSPLNLSEVVYMYPLITMKLYNESDGSPFHPNQTTSTTLRVFCSNSTIEQELTTNESNATIDCGWDSMRVYVTYGTNTYYRTLRPQYATSVDWYLINLNTDTAVQKQFNLNDLAGEFNEGDAIWEKIIGSNQVTIHQESWDVENKVIAYFILYDSYIISLIDNDNSTRVLGPFIADSTSSHTITVPTIPFAPEQTIDNFQFSYWPDLDNGWLYMQYGSLNGTVYNVTWEIVNASNTAQVFLNTSFTTSTGSANYTAIINGTVYKTKLTFNHSSYSTHDDIKTWGALLLPDDAFDGFSDPVGLKKWIGVIFITATTLMFYGLVAGLAAIWAAFWITFFNWIHWFNLGQYGIYLIAVVWVIAVMTWLTREGVSR